MRKAQPSLLGHLLAWTLGALVLVWGSFILLGFQTGVHESDELTDGHLASVAVLLLSQRSNEFIAHERGDAASLLPSSLKSHDYQQSLSVLVWNAEGRLLSRSGAAEPPAFDSSEGFDTLQLGEQPWRSFARWDAQRQRRVMVLLNIEERDDLAWDIALQLVEPGLWLLPVVALALGLALRRGLRPLHALSAEVHALDPRQPEPLPLQQRQRELSFVVEAINALGARYRAALARERELASELAHELRTPLASLALHSRNLRAPMSEAERAQTLERIELESLRTGQVLSELLALARASRIELAESAQTLDLVALAGRVLADYGQAALDGGHELALVGSEQFMLQGHPMLLELALRNLIENALSHTPSGSLVEVRVDTQARWLQVSDRHAPPDAEPTRAAAPAPQRLQVLGLGLGHRVVDKVATLHGAMFTSVPPPEGFQSCYRLMFAAAPGSEPPQGGQR